MYCKKCGNEIRDDAMICPKCGCATGNRNAPAAEDSSGFGWAVLGFFIPIVGLILYLVWKNEYPMRARSAGKGALVSVILGVIVYVIAIVFVTCVAATYGTAASYLTL